MNKLRRLCRRCDKPFTPQGKYCKICLECSKKTQWKTNKSNGEKNK